VLRRFRIYRRPPDDPDVTLRRLPSAPAIHLADGAGGTIGNENLGDAAERLLQGMRETHYQHRTHVDKAAGVYDMDCSGFADYLLKRIAPTQFAQLRVEPGHTRPRAAMYFRLFDRSRKSPVPGWEAVQKLGDARRGDLIAWELAASTQEPGDTGHVVIVAAAPVQQSEDSYRVEVYDSSGIHHDDDSRPEGTSGIGKGAITFKVDALGEPVGFQFNSHAHFHREPIAIGRLVKPRDALPRDGRSAIDGNARSTPLMVATLRRVRRVTSTGGAKVEFRPPGLPACARTKITGETPLPH
jgi:hypothetical protein